MNGAGNEQMKDMGSMGHMTKWEESKGKHKSGRKRIVNSAPKDFVWSILLQEKERM